jgi:hypothetical protein
MLLDDFKGIRDGAHRVFLERGQKKREHSRQLRSHLEIPVPTNPATVPMRALATFQLADFLDTLVSLLTAFAFGTAIGAERQYRQRTAGLRTNVLVSVGAARIR